MARYVYEPLVSPYLQQASEALRQGFREASKDKNPSSRAAISRLYPGVHAGFGEHGSYYAKKGQSTAHKKFDLAKYPTPNDRLYILLYGYGAVGCDMVGAADTPDGPNFLSPSGLAEHLCNQRLSKSFRDLRILANFSGTPYYQDGPSFASLLCEEMKKLGYGSIQVTGYLGMFADYEYAKRLVLSEDGSGQYVESAGRHKGLTRPDLALHRASAFKVTYT